MDELFGEVIHLVSSDGLRLMNMPVHQSSECYGDCCDNCDCYCERYCDDDGDD